MKQKPISPKKYIETKARTLPIHKCLVNNDWQEAGLANVIVMRRHVNGNITAGVYLVDLKCLGVKDTAWFFNEDEAVIMEKLSSHSVNSSQADYALAHNIVYAGHDFAMEFDIHPVKEFATSRFILEEDTYDIPLIDIETGDNGMPHLLVYQPGQYADALAKLRKNAGEGNYRYTVLERSQTDDENSEEEDKDNSDDESDIPLIKIPDGQVNLMNVRDVNTMDLLNKALVDARSEMDQVLCRAELTLRTYYFLTRKTAEADDLNLDDEWNLADDPADFDAGTDATIYNRAITQIAAVSEQIMVFKTDDPEVYRIKERFLQDNKDNPFFVCLILEFELLSRKEATLTLIHQFTTRLQPVPIIRLLLALESLVLNQQDAAWNTIIKARHAGDAISNLTAWGPTELLYFWAIQIIRHIREGNILEAVAYYDLFAAIDDAMLHLPLIMIIYDELLPTLEEIISKEGEQLDAVIDGGIESARNEQGN